MMGLALAAWITFNLLIYRLPATQGKSPIMAIFVAGCFIYVGIQWLRGRTAR